MAFTCNSQATSLPTTVKPIRLDSVSGVFIPDTFARKIVADYALLRLYRARTNVLTKQVQSLERVKDSQEAETRSLKADLADANLALGISQSNTAYLTGQLENERKSKRATVVKAVVTTIAVAILTGSVGYFAGRYIR